MAIITYPLNNVKYTAEDAETYLSSRTSGVFSSDEHFNLTVTGEREITISQGLAWIKNAEYKGKSVFNNAPIVLSVPLADGAFSRIDRVVLQFDAVLNKSDIIIKQGTPGSNPLPPDIARTELLYELGLYTINVRAGSVDILITDIDDTRLDESVCGVMRDGVERIPTAVILAEAEALLQNIRNELADIVPSHAPQHAPSGRDPLTPIVEMSGDITVALEEYKDYVFTYVTSLAITAAPVECHGFVTFAEGTPVVTVEGVDFSSGGVLTLATGGETWEFSVYPFGGKTYAIYKKWTVVE